MAEKKGKEYKEVASKILGCTLASYYNWDKQGRPIISLLEKYFSKEDLEEFLERGDIKRLNTGDSYRIDPMLIDHIKHSLKTIKGRGIFEKLNHLIPYKIFISILEDLKNDSEIELHREDSKKLLIERIKGYAASSLEKPSQKQLVNLVNDNFSSIECYVLIKYYDEILNKD